MSSIFFKCPICKCKDKETIMEDIFSVGDVVECPDCLNLLLVRSDYSLEDFSDILAEQVKKNKDRKKPKVKGKWDDQDVITVRCL